MARRLWTAQKEHLCDKCKAPILVGHEYTWRRKKVLHSTIGIVYSLVRTHPECVEDIDEDSPD